jgi:hypothetical protein
VWESQVDGRKLNFHLAGINNQNFIMRDEETGTWWQQVSGEAILGPMKGSKLKLVFHDELPFATWKVEQGRGRVLRPDVRVAGNYEKADWEEHMVRFPTVTPAAPDEPLPLRELIIGITIGESSRAYPLAALKERTPVLDTLGSVPLLIVVGDDKKAVRAFDTRVDGRALEFFAKPDISPLRLVDKETGSEWDFAGKAISGPLAGQRLSKIAVLADYWFDWKAYHSAGDIFR